MEQLVIPSSSKIYIDTAVVIYSVEWNPEYFELLQPLCLVSYMISQCMCIGDNPIILF